MSKLLNDWPARYAEAFPGSVALTDRSRGDVRTWRDLDARASAIARWLSREARVSPGDRVALLAPTRAEAADLFFACARVRAALVPLNTKLAKPELARVLGDAAPRVLVVDRELAALAHEVIATLGGVAGVSVAGSARPIVIDLDEDLPGIASGPRDPGAHAIVEERDPWLVLYTSGSTGRPKGALVTHGQIVWNAAQTLLACDLGRDDATITYTPLFYTGGWNVLSTPLWYRGATVHLEPGFEAGRLLAAIERERASVIFGVPTTLADMAAHADFATRDLSSLRVVLSGGAACPPKLLADWAARGVTLRPGYGLTEVGPNSFGTRPEHVARKPGTIGRPNLHLEARVLDEAGTPVRRGDAGELCLRGPTLFGGYLGNEAATLAAIDSAGYFHTGDLVREDEEGFFFLVGRKGEMFKSGGEKVYPGEVEAALARHPAVAEAVVFPVADARWGEVGRAVVVARAGMEIDADALAAWLSGEIARFKVPKRIVVASELPRLETGKVARPLVRERWGAALEAAVV
jgi:fatty-acyl-CoA synthase